MAAFDPATRVQRLERQLVAFERLHADDLREVERLLEAARQHPLLVVEITDQLGEVQRRLQACQALQGDELRLIREELADLRAALAPADAPAAGGGVTSPSPGTAAAAPGLPARGEASAADPAAVESAIEGAVESALEETVSRRELLGGQRPD